MREENRMSISLRAPVILLVAIAPACKVDPLFCDETHHCADPARPFCDLRGEYAASEGIARTCIPDPSPDGGPGAPMDFSIAVPSGRLFIRQGESAALDVTVERDAEFDEPIA